jgi:hypothetical protein
VIVLLSTFIKSRKEEKRKGSDCNQIVGKTAGLSALS